MNVATLGWLAALMLLPAVSLAYDFRPGRRDGGYEPVYHDPPWRENNRRGYWHHHRVPGRHGPSIDYFYHWHPPERFDRFEGPWGRP